MEIDLQHVSFCLSPSLVCLLHDTAAMRSLSLFVLFMLPLQLRIFYTPITITITPTTVSFYWCFSYLVTLNLFPTHMHNIFLSYSNTIQHLPQLPELPGIFPCPIDSFTCYVRVIFLPTVLSLPLSLFLIFPQIVPIPSAPTKSAKLTPVHASPCLLCSKTVRCSPSLLDQTSSNSFLTNSILWIISWGPTRPSHTIGCLRIHSHFFAVRIRSQVYTRLISIPLLLFDRIHCSGQVVRHSGTVTSLLICLWNGSLCMH